MDKLQAKDYDEANSHVTDWLEGPSGVSASHELAMDKFLASISGQAPSYILQEAGPWGALQEELYAAEWGAPAAAGMPLKLRTTRATRPWIELLRNGTFSHEVLADPVPASFMIERKWVELLQRSAAKHGSSWLHSLYLGTAALEMGDAKTAEEHFNASITKHPTVHAERALALFASDAPTAKAHYTRAWALWKGLLGGAGEDSQHVLELGREL